MYSFWCHDGGVVFPVLHVRLLCFYSQYTNLFFFSSFPLLLSSPFFSFLLLSSHLSSPLLSSPLSSLFFSSFFSSFFFFFFLTAHRKSQSRKGRGQKSNRCGKTCDREFKSYCRSREWGRRILSFWLPCTDQVGQGLRKGAQGRDVCHGVTTSQWWYYCNTCIKTLWNSNKRKKRKKM